MVPDCNYVSGCFSCRTSFLSRSTRQLRAAADEGEEDRLVVGACFQREASNRLLILGIEPSRTTPSYQSAFSAPANAFSPHTLMSLVFVSIISLSDLFSLSFYGFSLSLPYIFTHTRYTSCFYFFLIFLIFFFTLWTFISFFIVFFNVFCSLFQSSFNLSFNYRSHRWSLKNKQWLRHHRFDLEHCHDHINIQDVGKNEKNRKNKWVK